jgi:hypothetical protein
MVQRQEAANAKHERSVFLGALVLLASSLLDTGACTIRPQFNLLRGDTLTAEVSRLGRCLGSHGSTMRAALTGEYWPMLAIVGSPWVMATHFARSPQP